MNIFFILTGIFFLLDQGIKILFEIGVKYQDTITIIPDFFALTRVHNYGAAWSLFAGNRLFLILVAIFFLGIIYYCFLRDRKITKGDSIILGLLVGGVLGNLFDRIVRGYVVDYLSFHIFGYPFPVFNLADSCIVIAVILVFIDMVRRKEHE